METEGGSITIPNRMVETPNRRPISRNTQYMLTAEEAEQVRNDERVLDVTPTVFSTFKIPYWTEDYTLLSKSSSQNSNHTNWGLYRCTTLGNIRDTVWWGDDGTTSFLARTVNVPGSGKNVDVVIMDGHVNPNHPEYAVNADGTGGTRVVQYNWFQHDVGSGTGTYLYSPLSRYGDNHGAHVAGTACGNTQGWARSSNIYNINPYGGNVVNGNISAVIWDYVRAWHNSKPVNVNTGRKNPTIVNCSFGSAIQFNTTASNGDVFGPVTRIFYRGGDTGDLSGQPGGGATTAQLTAGGIFNGYGTSPVIPYYYSPDAVDIQDAIDEGILVVAAAGNEYFRIDVPTGPDYDNAFYATYNGTNFTWRQHRGTAPGSVPGVICVGSISAGFNEQKSTFSNTGSRIDIFAPGSNIQSSVNDTSDSTGAGAVTDPRDSNYRIKKINGTSMASPQVAGGMACVLETFPNLSQDEMLEMIQSFAILNTMRSNLADEYDSSNVEALQGALERIFYVPKFRPDTGSTFPMKNYKLRPTTGSTYPRTRIRRKG